MPPRAAFSHLARKGERRADGRAETLAEANAHRVEVPRPVAAGMPLATTALNSRAPSRCVAGRRSCAQLANRLHAPRWAGSRPPPRLCVFSRHTSRVRTQVLVVGADQVANLVEPQHAARSPLTVRAATPLSWA